MLEVVVVEELVVVAGVLDDELSRPRTVSVDEGGEEGVLPQGIRGVEEVPVLVGATLEPVGGSGQRVVVLHLREPLVDGPRTAAGRIADGEQVLDEGDGLPGVVPETARISSACRRAWIRVTGVFSLAAVSAGTHACLRGSQQGRNSPAGEGRISADVT